MSDWSQGDVLANPHNRPLHRPNEKSSSTSCANIEITLNNFLHKVVYVLLGTVKHFLTLIFNELYISTPKMKVSFLYNKEHSQCLTERVESVDEL